MSNLSVSLNHSGIGGSLGGNLINHLCYADDLYLIALSSLGMQCLLDLFGPISQTVFMLSIAINRAEHVCATVIIKHNYMLMCNHKIVINIMLCLLNSTGHR